MRRLISYWMVSAIIFWIPTGPKIHAATEYVVYNVYRGMDLGNPGEDPPQKDYYVNIGGAQGLRDGSILKVLRRVPTYEILSEQLYQDLTYPIALIKVIHVEPTAAIARLEKMLPADKTPSLSPRAIMVGDLVKLNE